MSTVTEADYWRRSVGRSKIGRVTNVKIRNITGITHTIDDDIKT